MDLSKAEKSRDELLFLMWKENVYQLNLERKKLLKIIDKSFLEIEEPTMLPKLEAWFTSFLFEIGLKISYEGNSIKIYAENPERSRAEERESKRKALRDTIEEICKKKLTFERNKEKPKTILGDEKQLKECPYCGAIIQPDIPICPICKSLL